MPRRGNLVFKGNQQVRFPVCHPFLHHPRSKCPQRPRRFSQLVPDRKNQTRSWSSQETTPGSSPRVPASCFFSAFFFLGWAPPKGPNQKNAAAPSGPKKKNRRDPAHGGPGSPAARRRRAAGTGPGPRGSAPGRKFRRSAAGRGAASCRGTPKGRKFRAARGGGPPFFGRGPGN